MKSCPLFPKVKSESFILASGSPRRKDLLANVGLYPEIIKPDIDEEMHLNEPFENYLSRVTKDKALAVIQQLQPGDTRCVLSADTVVILDDHLLQKPESANQAIEMLSALGGQTHLVRTGFCVAHNRTEKPDFRYDFKETRIHIRDLSTEWIKKYVATGEPMDKAGAYGAQGIGSLLIDKIEGSHDNVVGLPVYACLQLISSFLS